MATFNKNDGFSRAKLLEIAAIFGLMAGTAGSTLAADADNSAIPENMVIRLMPKANVANRKRPLDLQEQSRWAEKLGVSLQPLHQTPTGAWVFAMSSPTPKEKMQEALANLRADADVLWVDAYPKQQLKALTQKSVSTAPAETTVQQMVVGINAAAITKSQTAEGMAELLQEVQRRSKLTIALERRLNDGHWVLRLPEAQNIMAMESLARQLQTIPWVDYAEADLPVKRQQVVSQITPNDSYYWQQWALHSPVVGINAPIAWAKGTTGNGVTVAVVDTGVAVHPDLTGKVLSGYDFVSQDRSNDGDGWDADASDPGDWAEAGECGRNSRAESSSWHGTFVAGQIAAATNNRFGVAGVSWGAKILPVRVLGKCGGSFSEIAAGMLWSVGVPIDKVPTNPSPARVVNMSLGGLLGGCPTYMQAAVDVLIERGAIPVMAAGNSLADVADEAPAGCGGVVSVAALDMDGNLASYSNMGNKVDIAAPGGDIAERKEAWQSKIVGLVNLGKKNRLDDQYGFGYYAGTSMAAPHVSGVLALMLSKNPNLTYAQAIAALFRSVRPFPERTNCAAIIGSHACGAGMLDAAKALELTPNPGIVPGTQVAKVIEYYHSVKDQYFMTANYLDILAYDNPLSGWRRTGESFWVYPLGMAPQNTSPVCRFNAISGTGAPLYFWTANAAECLSLREKSTRWQFDGISFYLPQINYGQCSAGAKPIYRNGNRLQGTRQENWRYVTDPLLFIKMSEAGWTADGALMCAVND